MNKRAFVFASVLFSILGLCFTYVFLRLSGTLSAVWGVLLALPFLLVFLVPMIYWILDKDSDSPWDDRVQHAGFFSMALVSFFLVFTVLRDLLLLAAHTLNADGSYSWIESNGVALVLGCTVASMFYGFLSASGGPWVRKVEVTIPELPQGLVGFRIAQISDLHIGLMINAAYVERTVALVNGLGADVVALTGDIVDEDLERGKASASILAKLKPAGKIFYVPGNHEYYWNAPKWFPFLKSLGMTLLLNSNAVVKHQGESVLIAGVIDWAAQAFTKELPDLELAMRGGEQSAFKILLAHQPKIAPMAEKIGFDLLLSGHTHGGQFFPWTWIVRRVHPIFLGLERIQKMWVYVSPGTGSWGPPIRLGTRTEVTLLILRR